jgi:FkbH-like protein
LNPPVDQTWPALLAALRAVPPSGWLAASNKVARAVAEMTAAGTLPPEVRPLHVAILRSITAEVLGNPFIAALAEFGYAARVAFGRLGNLAHEVWDEQSFVYAQPHDVCVVLALAEHVLPGLLNLSEPVAAADAFLAQLEHLADRFHGLVIACNLAPVDPLLAPHFQAQSTASGRYAIARANQGLAELAARKPNLVICDLEALAARLGAEQFYSTRDMLAAMQPFSAAALAAVATRLAEVCALYKTTPVKCLVLDCDNTLWGGIIGEDGLSGIQLGETYPGLCYQQFQRQLDQLNRLGFLLALNSKNNEADVRQVFEKHPGMVLKPDQIAAARINWQDKATNMRALAEELNIGLDSLVFVDDSAFEINLIREQLPQVRCLMVPPEPWALLRVLPDAGVVDRLRVTVEDREKARMYAQERLRKEFEQGAGSLEQYLRGLGIRMVFEPFQADLHLARAAQLTQKTNQFNLTTRRYTEATLREALRSGAAAFMASLADRFGDYGRIALAIVRPTATPHVGTLDVFLLSCRVIGRGVEDSFLRLVMAEMKRSGFARLEAEFIPTAKNAVCQEFLAQNEFTEISRSPDGRVGYAYDLTPDLPPVADWITLC